MMEVFADAPVVIILQYISDQINRLYTLHLHSVICQLYLNKAGGKWAEKLEHTLHQRGYEEGI